MIFDRLRRGVFCTRELDYFLVHQSSDVWHVVRLNGVVIGVTEYVHEAQRMIEEDRNARDQ